MHYNSFYGQSWHMYNVQLNMFIVNFWVLSAGRQHQLMKSGHWQSKIVGEQGVERHPTGGPTPTWWWPRLPNPSWRPLRSGNSLGLRRRWNNPNCHYILYKLHSLTHFDAAGINFLILLCCIACLSFDAFTQGLRHIESKSTTLVETKADIICIIFICSTRWVI